MNGLEPINVSADDLLGIMVHNANQFAGFLAANGLNSHPTQIFKGLNTLWERAEQYQKLWEALVAQYQEQQAALKNGHDVPEMSGPAAARPN